MGERLAYLIGNEIFPPECGLPILQGPSEDLRQLARLLRDPNRGNFTVHELLNETSFTIQAALSLGLRRASPNDLVLIYYSGHGQRDEYGQLFLATSNTNEDMLTSAVSARLISELVDRSNCNQVILLLDCCYSGAFDEGTRGGANNEFQVLQDAASGFYILTASTSIQSARELAVGASGSVMGCFTAALVDGLENGTADADRKGRILLSDAYRHISRTVKGQQPQFFARRASGDPLISLSPATAGPLIDADILADLQSSQWHRRRGAVFALSSSIHQGAPKLKSAAEEALRAHLLIERDYSVRAEIEAALARPPEASMPAAIQDDAPPKTSPEPRQETLPEPFPQSATHAPSAAARTSRFDPRMLVAIVPTAITAMIALNYVEQMHRQSRQFENTSAASDFVTPAPPAPSAPNPSDHLVGYYGTCSFSVHSARVSGAVSIMRAQATDSQKVPVWFYINDRDTRQVSGSVDVINSPNKGSLNVEFGFDYPGQLESLAASPLTNNRADAIACRQW